jgi:hypothetical protein
MNYLVIYPGRFHPFHRGHMASYEYLTKKYGADAVYIATSDVQAPVTSPFSFADKTQMMTTLGVPASHVVRVKNPYQAREITDSLSDEEKNNTVLIFAVSEKDMLEGSARFRFGTKKNGEPSYLQPMPESEKQMQPMSQHAYVMVTPTVDFRVQGTDANSASQIRQMYIKGNAADRDNIIADLYGQASPKLRDTFDARLGMNERIQEIVYGQERIFAGDNPVSVMREHRQRLAKLLHTVKIMELRVKQDHQPLNEDLVEDYIEERWSQKYKRGINCSNPRGFSQKAHCAARRKRARGQSTKSKPVK